MSDENVELVRGAYAALAARNIEGLLNMLHHEIDWLPVTALIHGGQRYRGRYGVGAWYRYVIDNWAEYRERPSDLRGAVDHVLALGTVVTKVREDEAPQHTAAAWLWKLDDGLAVSMHAYLDQAKATQALREITGED
jgi:ketosteroid isomerase-like protein